MSPLSLYGNVAVPRVEGDPKFREHPAFQAIRFYTLRNAKSMCSGELRWEVCRSRVDKSSARIASAGKRLASVPLTTILFVALTLNYDGTSARHVGYPQLCPLLLFTKIAGVVSVNDGFGCSVYNQTEEIGIITSTWMHARKFGGKSEIGQTDRNMDGGEWVTIDKLGIPRDTAKHRRRPVPVVEFRSTPGSG